MSIFDRTRYLRALFVILPFGLLAIFYGVKSQFDLPQTIDLIKVVGLVEKTDVKREYSKNYETYVNTEQLFLKGHSKGYVINTKKDYEILQKNFSKGDSIAIWLNPKTEIKTIRQFSKGDEMILEYKRIDIAGLLMASFGLVALIISVLYIFKHPEDIKGG